MHKKKMLKKKSKEDQKKNTFTSKNLSLSSIVSLVFLADHFI